MAEDDEVRITLRLPQKLRDRLIHASEMNSRSMNGEIVDRLDWSFDRSTAEMTKLLEANLRLEEEAAQSRRDLSAAEAKAAKMGSLLNQARSRLGVIREERDKLSNFVKLSREGIERDFMGLEEISNKSDREILMKVLLEISRLSSEITIERSREHDDLADLITDLDVDNDHIEQAYLPGLSDDPSHGIEPVSHPKTVMGMILSKAIGRRTELAMRTIVKELEKNGMLALEEQPNSRPTAEEWNELRMAPKEIQGQILEALANVEIDRALTIARERKRKGVA